MLLRANVLYYAIAAVVLVCVSLFVSHRVAGPAFVIERAVRAMSRGAFDERLPLAVFDDEVNARDPSTSTPRAMSMAADSGSRTAARRARGPLLRRQPNASTRVHLDVEYPADGAVVGDAVCGAFVSGRALAMHGELMHFDVVIVIDTSRSTVDASGADINGNGVIGRQRLGRLGSVFEMGSTDPGDSILAAEVAAAFQLLRGLDPRSTRVGVVAFAGEPPGQSGGIFRRRPPPPALTLEPLTTNYDPPGVVLTA